MLQKVWDEKYEKGDSLNRYPWDKVVSFIYKYYDKKQLRSDTKILEVGFGSGCNLWFCAREGFDVFGVEGSEIAVKHAQKWFDKDNLKGDLKRGLFFPLTYDDSFFDLIIDRGSLTCVNKEDCLKALLEIYRVMTKNAYFLFNPYASDHTSCIEGEKINNGQTKIISGFYLVLGIFSSILTKT